MYGVHFDYPHTCPKIDQELVKVKNTLQEHIERIIYTACPLMSGDAVQGYALDFVESLYSDLEPCFETVRATNADMRVAADKQIEALIKEMKGMKND